MAVLSSGQNLAVNNSAAQQLPVRNATDACRIPMPCTEYLRQDSVCVSVARVEQMDRRTGVKICAAAESANEGDRNYFVTTGMSDSRCIQDWKGDGRCDLPNNHPNQNCGYDGGDCCVATCQYNCANEPEFLGRESTVCEHFCGEKTTYLCLDDGSVFSFINTWCNYGEIKPHSECYYSKLDVAQGLLECIMDDKSHGNAVYASPHCGNKTQLCTPENVAQQNGCHLPKDDCFDRPCCELAFKNGFITANPKQLPTLMEVYAQCESAKTKEEEPCFKVMVKCLQENRARKGGCCQCSPGWAGWRCRWPLCWPKCVHGTCVAPDLCHCEAGWKGAACNHAICTPECVPGQGTCVQPNRCECFYGWMGSACETPNSVPACVNGDAVSPDVCRCAHGWGGRLCDYPLCQSWPFPNADCGHGSCVSPFECECEPGWANYRPINATGYDIKPWWSKGKDISIATSGSYVVGDSRIIFMTYWDRIYNSSNAQRCIVPDCRLIYDTRCTECDPPPGGCKKCEPGFFLDISSGRCERCSNVFPHCQLCERIKQGPEQTVRLRCLHCDPLYVLEPVQYISLPSARCVSDGTVEFSSPVYHVFKDGVTVNLLVQRSGYGLDPSFAKPVEVVVRTRDVSAHSQSLLYSRDLSNFEFTAARVTLGVDASSAAPPHDLGSPMYDMMLEARVQAQTVVPVRIYDDASYHQGARYFDVDLLLPPEHLTGHQGPLRPFLTPEDHETTLPWMSPQNFGRTPLLERQDILATTRVYIWDHDEATAVNTTCGGDCQAWSIKKIIYTRGVLRIYARTHFGRPSMSPRDRFLVKYRPFGRGYEDSVGIVTEALRDPAEPGTFVGEYAPIIPGPYKVIIEKAVPGVHGEYWWHRGVHRNAPQLPDTTRIDHMLDYYWNDTADAPAFVRWQFHLNFECIRSERWPYNFGHALGILASPGSRVSAYFWNDGLIEERVIPYSAPTVDRTELIRHDCKRKPDGSPARDFFLCVEMLDHNPVVDPRTIYPFMVEFTPPMPEVLAREQPAFIQIVMYHQNDTDHWGWWPVQQGCLMSSGLHIHGSPFEGFEALSGQASALYSTVQTLEGNTREVTLLVDSMAYLRVDLRTDLGAPLYGGEQMLLSLAAELRTLSGVPDGTGQLSWDPFNRYYSLTFIAQVPAAGNEDIQVGRYQRELHVFLDGIPIRFSPMLVTVLMGFSDPQQARIITGRYTPARASEQMWFQVQSVDATGRLRTTGGDLYEVVFDGPAHDPLPQDRRFYAVVTDNLNGTYNNEFEIQRPGLYMMHVLMRNSTGTFPIFGSPFEATVYDELDPGLSTAEGPGVDPPPGEPLGTPARIRAGQPYTFVVTMRDTYDAQYFEGGARLRLEITSFDEAPGDFMEIRDRGDGKYDFRYQVCKAGPAFAEVYLYKEGDWHHIQGSPFPLEAVPTAARPLLSVLHPLESDTITFVPTSARIDLRDVCGNVPSLTTPGGGGDLRVSLMRVETGEDLPLDVAQNGIAEVMVFWTPGRRGLHEMSAQLGNAHMRGSPLLFNVTPAGFVPTHAGAIWVVGGVGASSKSTFEVLNSPTEAAEPARILISAKDMWHDPLTSGNDTFLLGLWREGGPCPTPTRCLYFSQDTETCAQVPSCRFDPYRHVCHSACGPTVSPAAFSLNLKEMEAFRLTDPSVDIEIISAKEDLYEYAFTTPIAGRYHGTVSVLRPGGLRFFYFDSDLMLRRVHTDVLKGPLDFDWGFGGPPGPVPATRFAVVVVGWLRVPTDDVYTFHFESDGTGRVVINGTEILRSYRPWSLAKAEVYMRAGFSPLQVEYVHQHTERAVGSRFKLSYSGGPVQFQVVPADAIYFEDVLSQRGNPFVHMVKPLRRAVSIAIDGMHSGRKVEGDMTVRATARVGQDMALRFHSIDRHGNVLVERDPTSLVRMYSEPVFTGGDLQGGNMVADRWRIVPLANGSWNVIMRPIAAPAIYNVTFELKSLYMGGVASRRKLRVEVEQSEVYPPTCWTICVPPAPQIAGTEVTCTVVTRDREGSELSDMPFEAVVSPPSSDAAQYTVYLNTSDGPSRRFYFVPTLVGTWTVKVAVTYGDNHTVDLLPYFYEVQPGPTSMSESGTHVALQSMLITEETFSLNITMHDFYGNLVTDDTAYWRVRLRGGFKDAVELDGALTTFAAHSYQAVTPRVMERALYVLTVEHVEARHRNNLRYCPELLPIFGRVEVLSDHRALGSVALLGCLSGYVRASGETVMRCEEAPDGSAVGRGEWRDRRSLRASPLVCRPTPYYCPAPDIPNSDITYWGWRREVGSRAAAACRGGYQQIYGDNDFVCGSRAGVGTWLTLGGDDAIMPVCTPIQHLCPTFTLVDTHIVNMSEDRIVGSVVHLSCDPGFTKVAGNDVVVCDGDGQWKQPEVVSPMLPPEDLTCFRGTAFCTDPSPYLEYGARVRGTPALRLLGIAEFECIEGWERLLGDTSAVCSRSRANDLEAGWFASDPAFGGQVDLFPLRCVLTQSWCPPISVDKGHLVSLSHEHYLGSRAVFKCAVGYEQVSGYSTFECRHNATKTGGIWLTPDGLHNFSEVLTCDMGYYFCPEPVAPATVLLSVSDGLGLGSVLTMSCANGYELDTPLEVPPTLVCQSGPGGVGEWATPDGLATPVRALACRGVRNWCPELQLPFGSVADVEGARVPGSTATLGCNLGYELQAHGNIYPGPERVKVVCDEGTDPSAPWLSTDGGSWMLEGGHETLDVQCVPLPEFCGDFLSAFTRLNGVYQAMNFSLGQYTVDFLGDRRYGSRAILRCNNMLQYFYSYGDTEIVCGYDANGTGSAWRSTRGMLAIPLHCYYIGTPVLDYVEIQNGCFDATDYRIGHNFGRSGSIVFWVRPTAWPPGARLVQGEHGNGQWEMKFESEGVISAKVTEGIGHVMLDITQNQTKGLGDWFHIAFIWELGLGLAGLGEVRVWVDGIPAKPATPGSHRLDHFTWVEPSDKIHIGGVGINETTPGDYSNLRVYSRPAPEDELREVRESEDPRCGIFNEVCRRPTFIRAHVAVVNHPRDPRFALFPLRPEAQLTVHCNPGYVRTRGDEVVECTSSGVWIQAGGAAAAVPLECCHTAQDWCPPLNVSTSFGLYIYSSSGAETVPCIADGQDGGNMGIAFMPCPTIDLPFGTAVFTNGYSFGSSAVLTCNVGYEPVSELEMDSRIICVQGVFNYTLHPNAVVPGDWKTFDGRLARLLRCHGVQNWCPEPELPNGRLLGTTAGRRMGSEATLECLPGYEGSWHGGDGHGSAVLVACVNSDQLSDEGNWTAPGLDGAPPLYDLSCEPVADFCPTQGLRPLVEMEGGLADAPQDAYNLTVVEPALSPTQDAFNLTSVDRGRLGSRARLQCLGAYANSHGDTEVVCSYDQSGQAGAWLGLSGRPAARLHCRDTRPAVHDAAWFDDGCFAGTQPATKVPYSFESQGTVALWLQLPNASLPHVAWSAASRDRCAGAAALRLRATTTEASSTTSTSTTTTTGTGTTGLVGLDSEVSNASNDSAGTANATPALQGEAANESNVSGAGELANQSDAPGPDQDVSNDTLDVLDDLISNVSDDSGGRRLVGANESSTSTSTTTFDLGDDSAGSADELNQSARHNVTNDSEAAITTTNTSTKTSTTLSTTATLTATTTVATTLPMDEENDTLCLGDQHMLYLDGSLHVQLGEGIGNISVPLDGVGPEQWVHLAYVWSDAGTQARLYLTVFGTGPDAADNTTLLSSEQGGSHAALAAGTVFEIYLGLPPGAGELLLEAEDGSSSRSLPRTYSRALSDREVTDLFRFEVPTCARCPEPPHLTGGLNGSFVESVLSSHPRVPPDVRRPGTQLYFSCKLGYGQTGGQAAAECSGNGTWVRLGTALPAEWLECCFLVPDFCPEANVTHFKESWAPAADCGPHHIPMVRRNDTALRSLGAKVAYECPLGYVRISGSDEHHCSLGLAGSIHGRWVDDSGSPAAPLACELDDHWCPPVRGDRSYVASASAGRRLGSVVFFGCVGAYVPVGGNMTLRCMVRSGGRGGWVDSYGKDGTPLRCGPRRQEIIFQASVDGGQEVVLNRRFHANASLACISTTRRTHGDSHISCVLGPDGSRRGGTGGRWVDENGDNAELPLCDLRPSWCPPVDLYQTHSTVVRLSDGYRHGSIAYLRCHVGYRYLSGNLTLECINNDITGGGGMWDGPPLVCELNHHFCPPLRPVNASVVESRMSYTLGEAVSFRCHRGFKYLSGDYRASCQLSDTGYGGQWKRADGTAAEFLACVPESDYCKVPEVEYGYVNALSSGGALGSVVELKCRKGFRDLRMRIDRQAAVCLHSQEGERGAFVVEAPFASRDLLRAVAIVGDLLEMLEEFEEQPFKIEDIDSTARLAFSGRWGTELRDAMRSLRHDEHVRRNLRLVPGYDADRGEPLSYFDIEHVRTLHRLLVAKTEDVHDIAATEARTLFGSLSTLKINFQDSETPQPDGWLRDAGHSFGERGNGFSYGWKCDTSDRVLNSGAHNRNLSSYTVVENTVVVTDLYSTCDNQEWRIELPTGRYYVEVVIQDPAKESLASGCLLQGESLGFPEVVRPPGRRSGRHLIVDVVDVLTFSGDGDTNCTSVNHITIQAVEDAGSRPRQEPLLKCSKIPEWCPPFPPPDNTHVSSHPDTALAQPLGGMVDLACNLAYVRESGSERFICGSDPSGSFGEWMMPGGRRAWVPLLCGKGRDWCPPLAPAAGAVIAVMEPPSYEYFSRAEFACRKGLRRVSGDSKILCENPGRWCAMDDLGRCTGPATANFLTCEPDPEYCQALPGMVYDRPPPQGHEAVAAALLAATTPRVSWVSMVLPVAAAPLGAEASLACPQHYHRVRGDEHVVCKRGATSGVWQKVGASTTGLVDDALAEPVVCELDPIYGVRRLLYTSADQLYIGNASVGNDVVPNIDQHTADYDASHFETHLRPPQTGPYAFSVEVVGKFVLVLEGRVLLEGRSRGPLPERFHAAAVHLLATEFYALRVQYELDPAMPGRANPELNATLPGRANHERVPRLVRLFWAYDGQEEAIVPPMVLRHTFTQPSGFPREIMPTSDPAPCISAEQPETITGLRVGDTGVLLHGTVGRNYSQDLHCKWRLRAVEKVRFIFSVNYFDLEDSPKCAADRWELRAGTRTGAQIVGSYCGTLPQSEVLGDVLRVTEMLVDFITDGAVEYSGFNVSYKVLYAPPTDDD